MPLEEADQLYSDLANKSKAFADSLKKKINPLNWVKSYDNIKHAYDRVKEVKNWFDKRNIQTPNVHKEIIFTGKHTDIANIGMYNNERMPCNDINNIQNTQLKANVVEEFNIAKDSGYVDIVNIDGTDYYTLTESGKHHINDSNFVEQYEKHQYQEIIGDKPMAEVHFQGNKEDLNVFRYTNKVDISKEEVSVKEYFQCCEENGWVHQENGFIKPTEKCSNWLSQSPDLLQAKGNIKMFDENSLKNIADVSKTTTNSMKAIGTGAKVTSAGTKVAGATATTAGVASGAATAGVGTVVTISVEGAKKLVEKAQVISQQLNQQINQSQSMKK